MIIKFTAQLFFIVAASIAGYLVMGNVIYMAVAAVIGLGVLALLLSRLPFDPLLEDSARVVIVDAEGRTPGQFAFELFYRLVLAVLIGAFWPSVPFIVGYGASRDRAPDDQGPPSTR